MLEIQLIVRFLIKGIVRNIILNPYLKRETTVHVVMFAMTGTCASL
jgi:hypothetical protein